MKNFLTSRARITIAVVATFVILGAGIFVIYTRVAVETNSEAKQDGGSVSAPIEVDDELVPPPRVPPSPSPSQPPPSPKPKASPRPTPPKREVNVDVYRGLGAWIDIYDSALNPIEVVEDLRSRGVKTLYLQSNNYRSGGTGPASTGPCEYGPDVDIRYPEIVSQYLDGAHARGINVVAWYLPGFADMDRDIRRSLAAINFVTASGNRFDGFAPDIETRGEFGCRGITGDEQRRAFNAGIVEYTSRLRSALPSGKVLGAIVVDARNNEKSPARWEGFPWRDIGKQYEAILPMAYWHAAKVNSEKKLDCTIEIDTLAYISEVISKTQRLMETTDKPIHAIGGVVRQPDITGSTRDCVSIPEVAGYVSAAKNGGLLGVSLYDYATMRAHSSPHGLWEELVKFAQ